MSQKAAKQALDLRNTNPALAAQLSLAAYRLAPTTEARSSLLSTSANLYATQITGHTSGVKGIAFSPDGNTLATSSDDKTVRLWDVRDPHHPSPLGILVGHTNDVRSVAFSPDGDTLATASDDTTAQLWNISDPHKPSLLGILTGHTNIVSSVAFSRDGHTLATGSGDRTARLWETNIDSASGRVCALPWPTITKDEWDQYLPGLRYRLPCS